MSYQAENGEAVKNKGIFGAIVACWFLGIGSQIAWNSLLTIEDYFVNIFPSYHPTRVLTLVIQPFTFFNAALFVYHEAKLNTRTRNLRGYILFFICTVLVIIIDLATSGKGGAGAFTGMCLVSAAFGVANAHVQGGMIGDLSHMQPKFIQSFLAGAAASGVLTSALRFVTKAAFEHSHDGLRIGAIMFFAIAAFLELSCVLLYAYIFPNMPIVRYYRAKAASEGLKTVSADLAAAGIQVNGAQKRPEEDPQPKDNLGIKQLMEKNWDYGLDLFLIYVLTLSIFPGFLSEDTGNHALGSWYSIVLIAMFNASDLIGRYTPLIQILSIESRKGIVISILSRFLFIPAFYFTAKYGSQGWMIMLTLLLGLTNGHLTVCVFTAAPKGYKGPEANALGNMLVLFLLSGIFAGVALDWLWLIGKGW